MNFRPAPALILMFAAASLSGCYMIADPDRKIVATYQGEEIQRGDLRDIIREMPDEERPLIQSRDDLLDTLNHHLNSLILAAEARELRIDEKITVDRAQARAIYLTKHPEYATIEHATDPTGIGISKAELIALQAEMGFGIDDIEAELYQVAALDYLTQEYVRTEKPKISDADFEKAYEENRDALMTLEVVEFYGVRFPIAPGAQEEAIRARKSIDDGVPFDSVLERYLNINQQLGISAALENNPTNPKFVRFWHTVTGAKPGDIFGPVYLESYDQLVQGPDGQPVAQPQPQAWVVIKIDKVHPARQKTLEEAKAELAMPILRDKVMDKLRQQYGVEVFPEELWRPEGYGNQFQGQMIKTKADE